MNNLWLMFLAGSVATFAVMLFLWWAYGRRGHASIVDVVWTLAVGSLAIAYTLIPSDGDATRRGWVAIITGLWALRLSWHIWHRLNKLSEDGRYLELQQQWGDQAEKKLLHFFMFQAVAAILFSLPMLVAAGNPNPMGLLDYAAITLAAVAVLGEAVADWQLQRFRESPENRGKTCRSGLWRYSRHPNYFFEWLHWFVYVLFALTAPWGWLTGLAPIAMLYFILYVNGVPPTEKQALKSRGEDYRLYQRETSVFFPWFPRQVTSGDQSR